LVLNNAPLTAFAWAALAEALMVALLLLVMLSLRGPRLRKLRATLARAKTLLADSWPLIISSASILIYMKIDQIMLGEMLGDEAVGIYTAAARVSEVWYFIAVAVNASVRPSLIELRQHSTQLFHQRLQKIFNLMVQCSVAMAALIALTAPLLITSLFGNDYFAAVPVLQIHVWAGVFVFLNNAVWAWYIIENKQALANTRILLGLTLNVLLNLLLIPQYGATGAAVATLVSRAFVSYFGQLLSADTRHLFAMMSCSLFTLGMGPKKCARRQ
jgi:O-antigen/teichoic acid export membrane protein